MPLANVPGVSFTPSATKVPTPLNYLTSTDFNWLNQYMPDYSKQIVDRYGNGDLTGMLEMQGNEIALDSDDVKWTEDGRLEMLATGVTRATNVFTFNNHTFRVNETLLVCDASGAVLNRGIVSAVTTNTFTVLPDLAAGWGVGTTALIVYAYSSEFAKKTSGMQQSLNSQVSYFDNKPIIIKEMIDESGSNLAQRTWLEVSDGNGGTGFVWFYKNYADTEKRFKNKIESGLIEGRIAEAGSAAATAGFLNTQGLFDAIEDGNIFEGPATDLSDFDEIIERMNAQGQMNLNYYYGTTSQVAAIDDMIKEQFVTSMGWGMFNNGKEGAVDLGFSGFKRSGYEIAYSRWRYLDNPTGRGALPGAQKVHAVMIPYGSTQIYDRSNSKAATLPTLHVRYRANNLTNRKFKVVMTGFEEGNSRVDEKVVDFLTERCLVTLSRNNYLISMGA